MAEAKAGAKTSEFKKDEINENLLCHQLEDKHSWFLNLKPQELKQGIFGSSRSRGCVARCEPEINAENLINGDISWRDHDFITRNKAIDLPDHISFFVWFCSRKNKEKIKKKLLWTREWQNVIKYWNIYKKVLNLLSSVSKDQENQYIKILYTQAQKDNPECQSMLTFGSFWNWKDWKKFAEEENLESNNHIKILGYIIQKIQYSESLKITEIAKGSMERKLSKLNIISGERFKVGELKYKDAFILMTYLNYKRYKGNVSVELIYDGGGITIPLNIYNYNPDKDIVPNIRPEYNPDRRGLWNTTITIVL